MAKKNEKGTAATVAVLSPEEFQKLTPEQQAAYLKAMADANAALQASNESLAKDLQAAKAEATKDQLPSIEIEEDDEAEIEGGTYDWTSPTFHWDDNRVISVKDLMAAAEGKDKKLAEKAHAIIAQLIQRRSGLLVRRKEEE